MNRSMQTAIAVDLGASNVRVALVLSSGKVVAKLLEPTVKKGRNGSIISKQIIQMIQKIHETYPSKIRGIGIASIGPLDYKRGGPVRSPNVPFAFIPLVGPLRRAFRAPISLFNDGNAAVRGEQRFGAGKNKRNVAYVTISTGIGGGVIAEGKLLFGKSGNAAEVGHLNIAGEPYNFPCSCGKGAGHWEGYASGKNMPSFFRFWLMQRSKAQRGTAHGDMHNAEDIFRSAQQGNPTAKKFLDALAQINARAISNIIAAYDPELITIGGSVALRNPSVILTGIKKYIDHYLPTPPITITKLGQDITLLGAVAGFFH